MPGMPGAGGDPDVLTRLDSLVMSGGKGLTARGILKTKDSPSKRCSIRFPDDPEKIQEVIGYGGDENWDSSDDDDEEDDSFKAKMERFRNGSSNKSTVR